MDDQRAKGTRGAIQLAIACAAGGGLLGLMMELSSPFLGAATAAGSALLFRYRALVLASELPRKGSAYGRR